LDSKKFLNRVDAISAENRLLKFVFIVLLLITAFNSFLAYYAWKHERTVMVPPGLKERVSVTDVDADMAYLTACARYVAGLIFSYTPATIKRQTEELLMLYTPEGFPEGKVQLAELVDRVTTTRMTSMFAPSSIKLDKEAKKIEVTGNRMYFADDRQVDTSQHTYVIEYRIIGGEFKVNAIYEKTGEAVPVKNEAETEVQKRPQ